MLLYDDNGTHSAMSAAELIARSGARLEIVTPERMLGIEVGGMNHVPYARAFNETDTRITLNQRVLGGAPRRGDGAAVRRDRQRPQRPPHGAPRRPGRRRPRHGRHAELYFELKPRSTNLGAVDYGALLAGRPQAIARNPDGAFQLFRIGDAVPSRNIHAAIYDALRLLKDL